MSHYSIGRGNSFCFCISSMLKQPRLIKAYGWVCYPVPDVLSGMLDHPSNISIMVLQKQPIQAVPHMLLHRAASKLVLGFCMLGAPIPFRHILLAYVLAFLGNTDVCRFPFPLSGTAVEERSSALGG